MIIIELTKEEIMSFIIDKDNYYGHGSFGIIKKYNDNTLLKLYYKDIIDTYMSLDEMKLDEEIDILLEVQEIMKNSDPNYITKLEDLIKIYNALKKTKSNSLIKGIATYKGYPIGVFLEYYKDYSLFSKVYTKLNNKNKRKILNTVKQLIIDLFNNDIYPTDIKENNILVNPINLDVKLIDLDGRETRIETKEYIINYPYIKRNCINNFNEMISRLEK